MSDGLQITQVHAACRNCGRDLGAVDGFQVAPQLCGECQFLPTSGDTTGINWSDALFSDTLDPEPVLSVCELCGGEQRASSTYHAPLCVSFRELERRVAALEARSIDEEDRLP